MPVPGVGCIEKLTSVKRLIASLTDQPLQEAAIIPPAKEEAALLRTAAII